MGEQSEHDENWSGITSEVVTDAVASAPVVIDVAGQVATLTDAHNDTATRVAALEKALDEVLQFVAQVVVPGINAAHVSHPTSPALPVVPVPTPAATVSKG